MDTICNIKSDELTQKAQHVLPDSPLTWQWPEKPVIHIRSTFHIPLIYTTHLNCNLHHPFLLILFQSMGLKEMCNSKPNHIKLFRKDHTILHVFYVVQHLSFMQVINRLTFVLGLTDLIKLYIVQNVCWVLQQALKNVAVLSQLAFFYCIMSVVRQRPFTPFGSLFSISFHNKLPVHLWTLLPHSHCSSAPPSFLPPL